MDSDELKKFKEEIITLLNGDQKLWELKLQIERLMSHVESEQRVTEDHGKRIHEISGAVLDTNESVGLRTWRRETQHFLNTVKWIGFTCTGGILLLLVKAFWDLLTGGTP